jgi:cation:H+ antiporter
MLTTIAYFVLGLVGLYFGGDWLVKGASNLARAFRVPPLVIGLTIVGFGTSTPELLVSVEAAWDGLSGIAVGNVVGSNIANILIILGLSALIAPLSIAFAKVRDDAGWMMLAAVACVPVFWDGAVTRLEGLIFVAGIVTYILLALRQVGTAAADDKPAPPVWQSAGFIALGLVTLMVGARLLVDSAVTIATYFGVSDAIIGLTIVAIGTSLPELATSVTAALRGQREIAIGNVVGSNVFNVFAILGITASITPIPQIDTRFFQIDTPVMIGVSLVLALLLMLLHGVPRWAGAAFLAGYAAYVVAMA